MQDIYILIDCIGRGGAEKIAVTLANELAEQGVHVHLLLLRRNIGYELSNKVALHVMTDTQFAKGYAHAVVEVLRGVFWARRILRQRPRSSESTLISHLTRSNVVNILLQLVLPRHNAICVSHNSSGFYKNRGLAQRMLLLAQSVAFPLAHRTVCVSKRMAADYRRLWLFRKNSVISIYNPVNLHVDDCAAGVAACLPESAVHLCMVGRLHPVKRHDLALQALAILKRTTRRTYILHVVGDGPEESRVRALIVELGLTECVLMHGWVEDTHPIVTRCSMSILCSDTEGFPNSIVESLAAGVPVVATDCVSGPRELLAPGEDLEKDLALRDGILPAAHGVLVRMGDAAALARGIEYQAGVHNAGQRAACIDFARQFDARTVTTHYCQLVAAAQ
jgi:glycosyltransferase involved in cell wall biosynthesis